MPSDVIIHRFLSRKAKYHHTCDQKGLLNQHKRASLSLPILMKFTTSIIFIFTISLTTGIAQLNNTDINDTIVQQKNSFFERLFPSGYRILQHIILQQNVKSQKEKTLEIWRKLPEQVKQQTLAILNDHSTPVDRRMEKLDEILMPYGGRKVSLHLKSNRIFLN